MHIKKSALATGQSPMQKALSWGENALKVVGTVKGLYDVGKEAYGFAQAIAPYAQAASALML